MALRFIAIDPEWRFVKRWPPPRRRARRVPKGSPPPAEQGAGEARRGYCNSGGRCQNHRPGQPRTPVTGSGSITGPVTRHR